MFIQTGIDIQLTTLKSFALADLDVEKSKPLMYIYFFGNILVPLILFNHCYFVMRPLLFGNL